MTSGGLRKDRPSRARRVLRTASFAYSVPTLVVLVGLFIFFLAVAKDTPFRASRVTDVAALGSGLIGGGVVALAIAWTEGRMAARQEDVLRRFQLGIQADLTGVDLEGINLSGIHLAGKSMAHASAANCRLSRVNLRSAKCTEGDFSGAEISQSTLSNCDFSSALMVGSVIELCEADARYDDAVMRGAQLVESPVRDATFYGVDATDATFVNTGITAEQISQFLQPPAVWS